MKINKNNILISIIKDNVWRKRKEDSLHSSARYCIRSGCAEG